MVVVGAGGAGLAATIEAANAGADVILLEKMAMMGGSSFICGGVIYAAGSSVQEAAGLEDSADDFFDYWMLWSQWQSDPALVKTIVDQSAAAVDWLIDLGVEFPAEAYWAPGIIPSEGGLYISGAERVPRGHAAVGRGAGLMLPLIQEAQELSNVTIMLETTGLDLIMEGEAVVGVSAQKKNGEIVEIYADSVVLSTGGFAQDQEMMRRHIPEVISHGTRSQTMIAAAGHTGDGINMAARAGADITGMDYHLSMANPEARIIDVASSTFPRDGYIGSAYTMYINTDGQRFVNESQWYEIINKTFRNQEDKLAWAIFDDALRQESGVTLEAVNEDVKNGTLIKADTLQELATRLGVSGRSLENTVALYNANVANGEDIHYLKESSYLKTISEGPFYASQITQPRTVATLGGVRINANAEVLNTYGETIPGLYAAGETTGGLYHSVYAASGTAITDAIVFGRIAGQNAAK